MAPESSKLRAEMLPEPSCSRCRESSPQQAPKKLLDLLVGGTVLGAYHEMRDERP